MDILSWLHAFVINVAMFIYNQKETLVPFVTFVLCMRVVIPIDISIWIASLFIIALPELTRECGSFIINVFESVCSTCRKKLLMWWLGQPGDDTSSVKDICKEMKNDKAI